MGGGSRDAPFQRHATMKFCHQSVEKCSLDQKNRKDKKKIKMYSINTIKQMYS